MCCPFTFNVYLYNFWHGVDNVCQCCFPSLTILLTREGTSDCSVIQLNAGLMASSFVREQLTIQINQRHLNKECVFFFPACLNLKYIFYSVVVSWLRRARLASTLAPELTALARSCPGEFFKLNQSWENSIVNICELLSSNASFNIT